MPNTVKEHLQNIPEAVLPPVNVPKPNKPILIYEGAFKLVHEQLLYEIEGNIYFNWLPGMHVKYNGSVIQTTEAAFDYDTTYELIIEGLKFGTANITNREIGSGYAISGNVSKPVMGDRSIAVTEVTFVIPNMKEFFGTAIKTLKGKKVHTTAGRLEIKTKDYLIIIDKSPFYKEEHAVLERTGGYQLLYTGKIRKHKGTIVFEELQSFLLAFNHFLYFLTGSRVAPLFLTGSHDQQMLWQDFTPYSVSPYKYVPCWSDISRIEFLQELWDSFESLWQDTDDRDFLLTVIHWYVEANANAAYVEGSIILAQTALELIYNWFLIERKQLISGSDAENLSAANKIRLILSELSASYAIPSHFTELLAVPDIADGPEAFVQIRNALVHGQEKKRRLLMNISFDAKYQALRLAIWYIEIALLKILNYKGKYKNRTSSDIWFNNGTLLPWDKSGVDNRAMNKPDTV